MRMGRMEEQQIDDGQQINDGQQLEEINAAVNEIVVQAEVLRRYSPRLAGEPALPGMP